MKREKKSMISRRRLSLFSLTLLTGLGILAAFSMRHAPTEASTERLRFLSNGRLVSRTTPNGDTVRYEYDKTGLVSRIKYSFWSSVYFDRNNASDLISVRDKSGKTEFSRDPLGRVSQVTSPSGQNLKYEYDPWGRITSLKMTADYSISYFRNVLGLVSKVDDGSGPVTYEYHPQSVVRRLPNGITTTFEFSPDRRVSAIVHRKPDGKLIVSFAYSYRSDGKQSAVQEETAGGLTIHRFEYDLLGRLSATDSSTGDRTEYTYDAIGNRKTRTSHGHSEDYEYDRMGRLIRSGQKIFRYDPAGNLIFKRDLQTGKTTTYDYDVENQLIAVRGPKVVTYSYDGLGNRIRREAGHDTSVYLNDLSSGLSRVVAVFDGSGKCKAHYLLADSRIAKHDANGRTRYYLSDRLGSIRFIVDEQGNILRQLAYSAFGQPVAEDGDDAEPFRFDGESWDPDAHLLYLRRRYYDPELGRFITADPYRGDLTNPRSLNRYAFSSNDPVNRHDPSGLQDDGGAGFSFDAPVIDSGSTYSGAGLAQSFIDGWNPSPLQFQGVNSGSVIESVKSALSSAFSPVTDSSNALAAGSAWAAVNSRDILVGPPVALAQSYSQDPIGTGFAALNAEVKIGSLIAGAGELGLVSKLGQLGVAGNLFSAADTGFSVGDFINSPTKFNGLKAAVGVAGTFGEHFPDLLRNTLTVSGAGLDAGGLFLDGNSQQMGMDQAPVGGVRLDKAAELLGSLASIRGAVYDPKAGRMILVGEKNVSLPPMRLDDLAVALRAAYSADPAEPAVTIDPDARRPQGAIMNVIFFGGTQNTHFGWVMFEADRVMKTYSVGRDNLTKAPLQSQIAGYRNLVQLGEADKSMVRPRLWSRFWLAPETIKLRVSSDGKAIIFDESKIKVCTETMRWAGNRLVSANPHDDQKADPRSPCKTVAGNIDEGAEYFAKHFTQNYDAYAGENKIYAELKRLAEVYAVAKWMKQAGIPIDLQWVNAAATQFYETPLTTPSISNGSSRTWQDAGATHREVRSVFGGTDLKTTLTFRHNDGRANTFEATILEASAASPEFTWEGKTQRAAIFPTAIQPDYGSFQTSSVDLLAVNGGAGLVLRRFYTSYHTASTIFGHGWSLRLPQLHFIGAGVKGERHRLSVKGHPGTEVLIQQFNVSDDFGSMSQFFDEPFVDQEWIRIGFRARPADRGIRGLYPNQDGSYSLMFTTGDEWRFNNKGNLIAAGNGYNMKQFHYAPDATRLIAISYGANQMQLEYNERGQVIAVRASSGGEVHYGYDREGNLTDTTSTQGRIRYEYDRDRQLSLMAIDSHIVYRNEYDGQGRLVRQFDSSGNVMRQQTITAINDGGRKIVETSGGAAVTAIYDSQRRPIEVRRGADSLAYSYYPDGRTRTIESSRAGGSKVVVQISQDQREVRWIDLRGTSHELLYDSNARLKEVKVNESSLVTYTRDGMGRPASIRYGKFQESFAYDSAGRLSSYKLDSNERADGESIQLTYGPSGRIATIECSILRQIMVLDAADETFAMGINGKTWRPILEGHGRISEPGSSNGGPFRYRYQKDGVEEVSVSAGDETLELTFAGGMLSKMTETAGGAVRQVYLLEGDRTVATDPYGARSEYLYHHKDLVSIRLPTGKCVDLTWNQARSELSINEH